MHYKIRIKINCHDFTLISDFRNGDILEQAYGYKFKDEFIWIGKTSITVLDEGHRIVPNIETALFELSNYEKFGEYV